MADEGLFSNLKFTDIFFPAAAAAASAYNPHIGRGLQTGMNLFNSVAAFQHDVKGFRQQQREWEKMLEDEQRAKEAAGRYAGFVDKQVTDREEAERKAIIAQMDGATTFGVHGPEGPALASFQEPMSDEDMKQRFSEVATQIAPQEFDVFGGTQLPGPTLEEQFAETAAPRTSEALPWLVDERVQTSLSEDPEYAAMLERQAATNLAGGTMALGPGSSIAALGNLGLGATSAAQEKARVANYFKELEGMQEAEFMRGQIGREARHSDALALQEEITSQKNQRGKNYRTVMAEIMGKNAMAGSFTPEEAGAELRRTAAVIEDMKLVMDPDDPDFMNTWMALHEWSNKMRQVMQGMALPTGEAGGAAPVGTGVDPEAERKLREAQERLRAITGG